VLLSALLLLAASLVITNLLPVSVGWRWSVTGAWLVLGAAELGNTVRHYRKRRGFRFRADGRVEILSPGGGTIAARLGRGSVILPRLAWLRVQAESGACCGELVTGHVRRSEDWRRLQVIGRLSSAC
jgi:hypothetical protein